VNYSTLPAYVTVKVQNDLILLELQPHLSLVQRWTAFQRRIVDELIEQWRTQTPWFCLWTMNSGCCVG